jgi:hypothetical protein
MIRSNFRQIARAKSGAASKQASMRLPASMVDNVMAAILVIPRRK